MRKPTILAAAVFLFATAFSLRANAADLVCPYLKAGDLFKVPGSSAVYYINDDLQRMYFPNSEVYYSWYADFTNVKELPSACVDNYPSPLQPPYGVNYRAGSQLVKVKISPSVYVIEPGNKIRKITSEKIARDLYGDKWTDLVRDVPDGFWINYKKESTDLTESKPHEGMLVRIPSNTTLYYVKDGKLLKTDEEGLRDSRIVDPTVFNRLTITSGIVTTNSIYKKPDQSTGFEVIPISEPKTQPKPIVDPFNDPTKPQILPLSIKWDNTATSATIKFNTDRKITGTFWSSIGGTTNLIQNPNPTNEPPFTYTATVTGLYPDSSYSYTLIYYDMSGNLGVPTGGNFYTTISNSSELESLKKKYANFNIVVSQDDTPNPERDHVYWSTNMDVNCEVWYTPLTGSLTTTYTAPSQQLQKPGESNDGRYHYTSLLRWLNNGVDYEYSILCYEGSSWVATSDNNILRNN